MSRDHAEALAAALGGEWRASSMPGYFASRDGLIASFRQKPRLLKGSRTGGGYLKICHMTMAHRYVHHLVCEAFHGPRPSPSMHCRHMDGNRDNNSADNLSWGTARENNADKLNHGTDTRGERNPMAKLSSEIVAEMRRDRASNGSPYSKIGRMFGVSTMTAYRAVENQSWK